MYSPTVLAPIAPPLSSAPAPIFGVTTEKLTNTCQREVLTFLAHRPIHTVAMVGFIKDNGLESPLNRGAFYGCRNRSGELEGVALIGHATMLETSTDRALEALARIAQTQTGSHMIIGEQHRIEEFWHYYAAGGQQLRRACRELLFELRWPLIVQENVLGLRLATLDDLHLIVPVHAQMALEESGVNPLEVDAEGFRKRCARRIEQGRTWVWIEQDRLIFKADVVSETGQATYVEGIWMSQDHRRQGFGSRCLLQLSRTLLERSESICLLVNEQNAAAINFYPRAGYKLRSVYDTIFLS